MKHATSILLLSVAVAAALAAGCRRDDDQAAAGAYDADSAAATTPPAVTADDAMGGMGDATGVATGPITDADFYRQALDGGRKEVAAATLAQGSAQDAGVKAYADTLVKDHTAMNQQVQAAAGQADAAAPAPDAGATAGLQGRAGADFDRAFVDMMVADHQKTIALFENAAQNASTDQAKSLAQEALPKLREHLRTAQDLQGKLGGTANDMGAMGDDMGEPGT